MKTYGQFCPIARASEILAERWTILILRNLLLGCETYSEIAAGAPGIPRALLTARLRELQRTGVVDAQPLEGRRGHRYHLTDAGKDLQEVLMALGAWGERWLELTPSHVDPSIVLWSWSHYYLASDRLPAQRVVVHFRFPDQARSLRDYWMIFDQERTEVCTFDPGFGVDLDAELDSRTLAEWHLGHLDWNRARRDGRIRLQGSKSLAQALPRWKRPSDFASVERARHRLGSPVD
ncbi:MAG: winged helix-turn-helix transcriptional regulator [Candidatus Eisenbacteria bacterium]|uniref:Winged helix-turn-helix transcriptional regulator n=1 Tax=Eiseniibacteriota bacterium TaxID=2212470 RepID=A0A956RPV8_UNCEI|nr:winged helix-turn-helix transcriptional regulator [Candidatus Eisenbacteria bacterium]